MEREAPVWMLGMSNKELAAKELSLVEASGVTKAVLWLLSNRLANEVCDMSGYSLKTVVSVLTAAVEGIGRVRDDDGRLPEPPNR